MTELEQNTIQPDIGLNFEELTGIVNLLKKSLGTIYTLAIKTKKYHWNVTGLDFYQLHELFDEQYNILLEMNDNIAEYIRQYGMEAPGTLSEFQKLSMIDEKEAYNPKSMEMIADLVADYETIIRNFRDFSQKCNEDYNDVQAEDLFIGFMHILTKQAWFLRAHLE